MKQINLNLVEDKNSEIEKGTKVKKMRTIREEGIFLLIVACVPNIIQRGIYGLLLVLIILNSV